MLHKKEKADPSDSRKNPSNIHQVLAHLRSIQEESEVSNSMVHSIQEELEKASQAIQKDPLLVIRTALQFGAGLSSLNREQVNYTLATCIQGLLRERFEQRERHYSGTLQ